MIISQSKILQYGIYSNAIYVFLLFLFHPNGFNLEKLIISSFLALSVVLILMYCYINLKKLKEIPITARRVYIFLIFWSAIVVIRGFSLSFQDWITNFGNVYMALAWLTPILIIAGQKIENWKIVFKSIFFMFKLMLLSMFFLPFYVGGKLPTEWTWLVRPVNFFIIIGINRFKFDYRVLIYTAILIYLILAVQTQQRIEFIYLFLASFFILIDSFKQIKIKRSLMRFILIGFLILLFLVFTYGYENINLLANKIIEFQDSRTFLFTEIAKDLKGIETFVGRGSLGTYYSEFFERVTNYYHRMGNTGWRGDDPIRITTEVGYLQMILKGGFLLLLLNLFLMIYSSYVALFKSNNRFVKRLGLYILIITILSLISFRPAFTPTFIILWIAIGTVLNKKNRMFSNKEINKLI